MIIKKTYKRLNLFINSIRCRVPFSLGKSNRAPMYSEPISSDTINNENCIMDVDWFSLNEDSCIRVWVISDRCDKKHLQMRLEKKMNGTMGPFCDVVNEKIYKTFDLSFEAISNTLREICVENYFSNYKKIDEIVARLIFEISTTFEIFTEILLSQNQ